MKAGWGVSSCSPSDKATPAELARLEFGRPTEFATPDGALAEARKLAKAWPWLAVKVTHGTTCRWLFHKGSVYSVEGGKPVVRE